MSPVFAHGQLRLYLLALLDEAPRHGYEVIRALEERFGGVYSPSAGSVYPRLARLEEEGLVARTEEGRTAVYRITDAGRAEVRRRAGDIHALRRDLDDSARRLVAEARNRVRADADDLRSELKRAAREARRAATDAAPTDPPGPSGSGDVEDVLRSFVAGLRRDLSALRLADDEVLDEVREVLDDARHRVRELLGRAERKRRERSADRARPGRDH